MRTQKAIELNLPILYPKQLKFCQSKCKFVGYGGARGGGKSYVLRPKAIDLSFKYPGIRILFLRKSLPDLKQNHFDQFQVMLNGSAKFNQTDNRFVFPNGPNPDRPYEGGSVIQFGYFASEGDWIRYQGQAYQAIFLDEATQFTETQFMKLKPCLRIDYELQKDFLKKFPNFKSRMYLTANPGGVGHLWFKRLFIDRNFNADEDPNDYEFIQALVFDNEVLMENDPDYVKVLKSLPEKERQAMLYGDWSVFEGQFFDEFDEKKHTFDPNDIDGKGTPFTLQPNWRIYRTRDYGLDKTACYWCAVDEEGTFWIYKGLWESNLTVSDSGKKINSMTLPNEIIYLDICPPDMWNRQNQTGKNAVDILFQECNQFPVKANNDRITGWLMVKEFLKVQQHTGRPKLMISQECPHLIESLKMIQHDENNVNDCAKEPHEITHSCDAIRYLCTSYTYAPDRVQLPNEKSKPSFADYALNMGDYANTDSYGNDAYEEIDLCKEGWFI